VRKIVKEINRASNMLTVDIGPKLRNYSETVLCTIFS
jgi:hypothetical protein